MKGTFTNSQYVIMVLLVSIFCCVLCVSTVGAAETQSSTQSLLQNPFSSSPDTVLVGENNNEVRATSQSQTGYRLTLTADRNKVYYQGKIRFDATLVKTGTNEPVKGITVIFRNLQDDTDTRSGVTNSYGKAVAGAYARVEPPQSEQWIAEATVDGTMYSSQPVSILVLEFDAPVISNDAQIYINPFSGADIISPYAFYDPAFFSGYIDPLFQNTNYYEGWTYGGWMYTPTYFPSYYPSFTLDTSGNRPYYPSFTLDTSGSRPYYPLFFDVASRSPFPIFY